MQPFCLLSTLLLLCPFAFSSATNSSCHCTPLDPCWPSSTQWEALNATTNGQLIKTVPVGHVCHDPTYDEARCKLVREKWPDGDWRSSLPEAIFASSFVNFTCDPMGAREDPCEVGRYAQYTINVTSPLDISAGLAFAKKHNIRLVVKNTGHDYLGRSVGYGSLSLWTHNLKTKELIEHYDTKHYSGPAAKLGAGVQVLEAYNFVDPRGYMMVGGECGSVGVTGGYTAGGGQSPLSSYAGLAADQALEFEVVLADGQLVRASADENPDLHWALSGGGPGYGVVWSVTYKIFKDVPVTGTWLTFNQTAKGNNSEAYWKAIETWYSLVPRTADLGGYTYTVIDAQQFSMPLFVPNRTRSEVLDLLSPLHNKLKELGIGYSSKTVSHPKFLDAWKVYFEPQGPAGDTSHLTSHLIEREVFYESLSKVTDVARSIIRDGGALLQMVIGASHSVAGNPNNAVNPGWRNASMLAYAASGKPNSTDADIDNQVTHVWGDRLRSLSPASGTYMNEADVYTPDFQQAFYGENYARLLLVKKKYDPEHVFYAETAVGSEDWVARSDGRLCRAG